MSTYRAFRCSFNGGEVTPEFFGKVDDQKFATAVATMCNFIPLPHGPARNRPGFEYVAEVKDSSKTVRLIRFTYSVTQTMVIELGAGYFRFHTDGATLIDDDGDIYEVENNYAEEDLFSIKYVQSNDILTLVHPKYPPMELRRYGVLDWRLEQIDFTAPIEPPTGLSVSASYGSSSASYTYNYAVTAVDEDDWESTISESVSVNGNLYATGGYNTVNWEAVDNAVKYKVYKKTQGVWGYIGSTTDLTFKDDLITADASKVPPEYDVDFSEEDDYPGAVTYYEQRRCFARTNNSPQTIWMTKTGTENNMSMPIVTSDDDAIEVRASTRDANTILHMVPLTSLVILTSSTELVCTAATSGAMTQTNIMIKPQAYVGSSDVQPVIVNNIMFYIAARGNHSREMGYSDEAGGLITADLSLRAPHLFDGKTTKDMAFSSSPYPIVWQVNSDGDLLCMTYIPEEKIGGWHMHTTDGEFQSCCVVTEDNDDRLYVIVKREINGETKQYIERMTDMLFDELEDAFFVDCGLTGEFSEPVTTLSGLDHLEGKTVSILGDGAVFPQQTIVNGTITLEEPVSKVTIGLPYRSTLKTLPLLEQVDSAWGTMRPKNINQCALRVHQSSGIFAGWDEDHLREYAQRRDETPGFPPEMRSEEIKIVTDGYWNNDGQLMVVQDDPLPLTVVSLTLEVAIGG